MNTEVKMRFDTIEAVRSDMFQKYQKTMEGHKLQRFHLALDSELLQKDLFSTDYLFVAGTLQEWKSKIQKEDNRYKVLSDLEMAVFRMYFFAENQENLARKSITEYQIFREQNNRLLDTNLKLRNEVKSLKNEIEFLNKNS